MLYSLNNQRPAPLPFRIHLNGTTRTDPSTFTPEEIAAAGYTGPYTEPPYDASTQQLDWINGAYVVSPLPPPAPEPDWFEFSTALMSDPAVNAMLGAVLSVMPALYGGLTVGLNKAAEGDYRPYLYSWNGARQLSLISNDLASAVHAMAVDHNLPAEFTQFLVSQGILPADEQ